MENYDKNKETSYFEYWDRNNLYCWEMSQKLPVNNFDWIKDLIKNYNEEKDGRYFFEIDVQYIT